jgi:hypothetical protein
MRAVRVHECERVDIADELREAKRIARRELARDGSGKPAKAVLARAVADLLGVAQGPHGDGFTTGLCGFGGQRWFFRCGGCGSRAWYLYRPQGAVSFRCRLCWRLGYSNWRRGDLGIGRLHALQSYVGSFEGRPGRRPRRHHRAVQELGAIIFAGMLLLAPD